MSTYIKAVVIILITLILGLVLPKNTKEFQVILTLGACTIVLFVVLSFLEPMVSMIRTLTDIGDLDEEMIRILLKATGVGLLTEYVALICQDSGNNALGKLLQVLGAAAILWLSLPLISRLMDLVSKILTAA